MIIKLIDILISVKDSFTADWSGLGNVRIIKNKLLYQQRISLLKTHNNTLKVVCVMCIVLTGVVLRWNLDPCGTPISNSQFIDLDCLITTLNVIFEW